MVKNLICVSKCLKCPMLENIIPALKICNTHYQTALVNYRKNSFKTFSLDGVFELSCIIFK